MFDVPFTASSTDGYMYSSFTDPEQETKNSPLVFTVGGNKELSDLNTNLEVWHFSVNGTQITGTLGEVAYYAGTTNISHVAAGQNAKPATSVVKTFRKMSKAYISNVVNGNRMFSSAKTAKIERSAEKFTTLKVNTSVCEPLPFAERQIVRINK